jgi:Xaa-Pro aminopeptidase
MISPELFIKNRKKLTCSLKNGAIAVICPSATAPRNGNQPYPYRQSSNLLYFTGIHQEETYLFLYPDHPREEFREVLFIRYTDEHTLVWEGPKLKKKQASCMSGINNVMWTKDMIPFLSKMLKSASCVCLEMGEEWPPKKSPLSLSFQFAKELEERFSFQRFQKIVPDINKLRIQKENAEIEIIKQAINITNLTFRNVLSILKPGLFEYDIEAEITRRFTVNERCYHAYLPIVAGGANANALHYNQNNAKLKKSDLLLLDFGAEREGYASDLSRTIPVSGKFSKRQAEVYSSVLKIQKQIKKLMVPKNTIEKLNVETAVLMEEELVKLKLLNLSDIRKQDKENPLYKKYYPHGVSHFIGLDVHDSGTRETPFKKGMVLSCEPGIYIQEEGFGIRLENDVLVDQVPIDLMEDIPVEIEEIENLMQNR